MEGQPQVIPVNLERNKIDFVEMQFSWALGNKVKEMSKGQLTVLSIFYLYRDIKEAKKIIVEKGLRTSSKSIDNDITFFKSSDFIDVVDGHIIFKGKGGAAQSDKTFVIKVKVID